MADVEVKILVEARDRLGEGAFWCPVERVLYWLDVAAPSLQRWDPASGRHDVWPMPEMITSMAKRSDGALIVASYSGLNIFEPNGGVLKRIAAPEACRPGYRPNDGAPDGKGRFWYGTMADPAVLGESSAAKPAGVLWKIEPNLQMVPMETGLGIPNGLAWSLDWKTFYLADTAKGAIFAWDFDLELGAISNKRVFSALEGRGYPDGACIDAQGGLWSARWEGAAVVRFSPDGGVDRIVPMPCARVTSCAFGGADLGTLYVTSSRMDISDEDLAAQPLAGGLFAFRPGVKGLPRSTFGG